MRALKPALVFFVLIAAAATVYIASYFHSCFGQMHACYASFRSTRSGGDQVMQERFRSVSAGFTASEKLVAFPVPVETGRNGIVLVSLDTDRIRLISTQGYSYWSPQLSADGERLVFVRGAAISGERELVTCEINSWQCSVLFRTSRQLTTPVDVGNDYVLFVANEPRKGDDSKSRRFDIFAVRRGASPTRLTNYEMYEVQSLSIANDKIVFGADGRHGFAPSSCLPADYLKCDKSDIYALDFDRQQMVVLNRPDLLRPLFVVAGYSTRPVISADAKRIAFKNTNRQGNPWRYNMAISDVSGIVEGEVPVQGHAFSTGAFVGNELFVNEVFPDRYRVSRIDLMSNKVDGFDVKHSQEFLRTIEEVRLSVDGLASAK